MSDIDGDLSRRNVQAFSDALSAAVFDVSLERAGYTIQYILDASVVIPSILGLDEADSVRARQRDVDKLLGALWSTGYLGVGHLLQPHVLELEQSLNSAPRYTSRQSLDSFLAKQESYIATEDVRDELDQLGTAIRSCHDESARAQRFIDVASGPTAQKTFVVLDMLAGTWQQRLKRQAGRILRFDDNAPDVSAIMSGDVVWSIEKSISGKRDGERYSLRNIRDSVALAQLNAIMSSPATATKSAVRFFTPTPAIHRALRSDMDLRRILTDTRDFSETPPFCDPHVESHCRCVVRSAWYFMLRAAICALAFKTVGESRRSRWKELIEIGELEGVASHLSTFLASSSSKQRRSLRGVEIDGKSLGHLIRDLFSLSFLRSIWCQHPIPNELHELLSDWVAVWEYRRTRQTNNRLKASINDVRTSIQRQVEHLYEWQRANRAIADTLRARRLEIDFENLEPLRDLGLIRWGIEPTSSEVQSIRGELADIMDSDEHTSRVACARLSGQVVSAGTDRSTHVVVCAVLWALNQHLLVHRVISSFRKEAKRASLPLEFDLMSAAAEIRGRRVRTDDKAAMLDRLEKRWSRAGDSRARYTLGLAYVYFHAWSALPEAERTDQVAWPMRSIELCEELVDSESSEALRWAFALNHCTYVGALIQPESARVSTFARRLAALQSGSEVWNYRFADTLAVRYLLQGQSRLNKASASAEPRQAVEAALASFDRAARMLDLAEPDFGDPDIVQHRTELDLARNEAEAMSLHLNEQLGRPREMEVEH